MRCVVNAPRRGPEGKPTRPNGLGGPGGDEWIVTGDQGRPRSPDAVMAVMAVKAWALAGGFRTGRGGIGLADARQSMAEPPCAPNSPRLTR
jgi:hypothetical protein